MRVMILSMLCGEGHNAYARTILQACKSHGHETEFVDIFEFDKYSHNLNNKGYQFLCKYLALPYDMIWKAQLTRDPDKRYKGTFQSWIIKAGKYVLEKLLEFRPDAVFSTHYYASAIMTNIKRKNLYNVRDYALLTDYMAHPNWEASVLLDRLFIPTQDTIPRLIDKGFSMKQLFISGLPVSDSFKLNITKEEAREKMKLPRDAFLVLVMNGGNGVGTSTQLISRILAADENVTVIAVAGKSKRAKEITDRYVRMKKTSRVVSLGFSTDINYLMKSADVIVTRGGAGVLNEAIHSSLPIIIRERMIINERENKCLLIQKGLALGINTISEITSLIKKLISHPEKLEFMRERLKAFQRFGAADAIVKEMELIHSEDVQREKNDDD